MNRTFVHVVRALLLGFAISLSAHAADSDALQGKWKADKEINGEKATFNLELKQDKFTFELRGSDGEVRFVVKGNVKLEKQGPFKSITLSDIEGGQSMSDLQAISDVRSFVYVTGYRSLTLAGNFDRGRENEEANLTVYRKQ